MNLYRYGSYAEYVEAQTFANRKKLSRVWVTRGTVELIARAQSDVRRVLCHGTRNGAELRLFREVLAPELVIGTEISDTAEQFPDTVRWDFHDERIEWSGLFDVVYSNSLDHAYDPDRALRTWIRQCSSGGRVWVEYGPLCAARPSDPFQATHEELREVIERAGGRICSEHATTGTIKRKIVLSRLYEIAGVNAS